MKAIKIPYLYRGYYKKMVVNVPIPEHYSLKADAEREGITIFEAWRKRQEIQPTEKPTQKPTVQRSEKQAVEDALRGFPDDCPDMFSVEGAPTLRQCVCPMRERPIDLPKRTEYSL